MAQSLETELLLKMFEVTVPKPAGRIVVGEVNDYLFFLRIIVEVLEQSVRNQITRGHFVGGDGLELH